ncbi:MAG: DUF5368 family protein [Alphaproteobacteria bacterium]
MAELSFAVLWAIVSEMLGLWLWPVIAAAVATIALVIAACARAGGPQRRAWRSGLVAAGLSGALAFLAGPALTQAGFANLHTPADWLALALFALLMAIAGGLLGLGVTGLVVAGRGGRRRSDRRD